MVNDNIYHSRGITYRHAVEKDEPHLRRLLHDNAMNGWVNMAMEREPNYFKGNDLFGATETVIACRDDDTTQTVGMYSCSFMSQHINGNPTPVGYLGGLRVNARYRNKLSIVRHGYDSIRPLMAQHTVPLWMTSIAQENHRARRLLEAGLKGLPRYMPIGELDTLAFSTYHGNNTGVLQQASYDDIPALVAFYNRSVSQYQFSPVLNEDWMMGLKGKHGLDISNFYLLKDKQLIKGCVALWDQRKLKQVVAHDYRFPFSLLRSPYNAWANLTGRVTLPKRGHKLESIYLAFAVFPDNTEQALAMLRDAIHKVKTRNAQAAILSLSSQNPVHPLFIKKCKPTCYRTCIETVVWPDDRAPELNTNPVQPEAAIL